MRRPLRLFLFFAAMSLLARGLSLAIPILDKDEACYVVGAQEILHGRMLYADFADQHPPGAYYFYAGAQAIFGYGTLGVRLISILLVVPLTALAASAFFRHDRRGVLAGILFIIFGAAFMGHDMLAVNCEILMALPLAWAAVLLREEAGAARWTHGAAAGVLTGLAVVVKYQSAFWGPAFAVAVLLASIRRKEMRLLPGRWLALAGGFAVPLLACYAAYAAAGAGPEFLYWNLAYNMDYTSNAVPPHEILGKFLSYLVPFLAVTAPLTWGVLRSLRDTPRDHGVRLAALLVACSIPAAFLGLRFYPHYFFQSYWPLAVGAAPAAATVLAWPLQRAGIAAAIYSALLWGGFTTGTAVKYLVQEGVQEETRPVFAHVAQRLRDDPCFPGANLFVWGYAPSFYYEARLPVASRFVMAQTGLVGYVSGSSASLERGYDTSETLRNESWNWLMADLAKNRPTYILDTAPARIRHWEKYPLERYPLLATFVAEGYDLIAEVDRVRIYRRKDCGPR